MENIYYLLICCLLCWYFIYLRKVSEAARVHIQKYCKQSGLQFIAIARRSTRLKFNKKRGIIFHSIFDFEFSGDGESNNQGTLALFGLKLDQVNVSAYRVH